VGGDTAWIRYSGVEGKEQVLAMSAATPRLVVGRGGNAAVALTTDSEVSVLHAVIEWFGTHWTVVDGGLSCNGTFINDQRLKGRRRLLSGDQIRVGRSLLTFEDARDCADRTRGGDRSKPPRGLTHARRKVLVQLCRPYAHDAKFATPASNQEIAHRLGLTTETVRSHLCALFITFDIDKRLPPNSKRVRLVQRAMATGVVTRADLQ
jgi:hypothetical protein